MKNKQRTMIRKYKFTGFLPSRNPFDWYHDKEKGAFTTSIDVATWNMAPKIGDTITFESKDGKRLKVFINDELVYEATPEKLAEKERITQDIYDNLKKEKGLI